MLWNLIFEFFVKYVFGGYWNGQSYVTYIGQVFSNGSWNVNADLGDVFPVKTINIFGVVTYLSFPSYLSLIATIITIIIILLVIGHFIKKTFNLFGRII